MAPRSLLGPQTPAFLGDDPWMRVPGHENAYKPKPKAKDARNWQQKVRDALNDMGRKYLGPHGDAAFGLLGTAAEFSDAADLRDAVEYGGKMGGAVQRGDWWGAASAAPWMLAASGAAMLPGVSLGAADEAAQSVKKGIRAFHGSPHDFDRFDMSKIGTGEGAQAYGHGLYFAENEDVAQGYRDALRRKGDKMTFDGKPLERPRDFTEIQNKLENDEGDWRVYKAVEEITRRQGDLADRLTDIRNWYTNQPEMLAAIDRAEKRISLIANPGKTYEVNINADPDTFLDWDKPLGAQPVYGNLQDYARQIREMGLEKEYKDFLDAVEMRGMHGSDFVTIASGGKRNNPALSADLKAAGVPGIKYLDAGSRGDGDGTRNYVVFDGRLVEIVRKYGIAGASAILGYNIMANMDPAQAAELRRVESGGGGW